MEEIKNQQNEVQGTETAEQIIESLRNEVDKLKKELEEAKENSEQYKSWWLASDKKVNAIKDDVIVLDALYSKIKRAW